MVRDFSLEGSELLPVGQKPRCKLQKERALHRLGANF
jgi:hypothetical protein